MIFKDHPILSWFGIGATIITLAFGAGQVWSEIKEQNEITKSLVFKVDKVRSEQINIRKELATQTIDLGEIRKTQVKIESTIDRRIDKLEEGHDRIVGEIHDGITNMAIDLGRMKERTKK